MRDANVLHGDICERNVCIQDSSIQLIDFGEVAPDYKNDVVATGTLLLRCMANMTVNDEQRLNIAGAAAVLIEHEDVAPAIDCDVGTIDWRKMISKST